MPLLWIASALAGNLVLGAGTVVVVTDVGGSDPSALDRGALIGEVCAVGAATLQSAGDGWWKGTLHCASGVTYNVTTVAVAVPGVQALPRAVDPAAMARQIGKSVQFPVPPAPRPEAAAPPATSGSGPAPSAPPVVVASPNVAPHDALQRAARAGEAVRIAAVSPEDAFFRVAQEVVGRTCYPTDAMAYQGDGWQAGPLSCWDGESYYFYKVALASDPTHTSLDLPVEAPRVELPAGTEPARPPAAGGAFAEGTRVVIADIAGDDGFFPERGRLVGKRCRVTGELRPVAGGEWYGGGLTCGQRYLYFYKVRVSSQ